MELDDRVTISMPEGGELELQLAGLGSRFIAGVVDLIIQVVVVVVLVLLTGVLSGGHELDLVVFVVGLFVTWFGYPIAFELLARGRTPGKRLTHLRVVRDDGQPVDLPASAIRNLLRIVDGPTLSYVPTIVSILVTKRNQRLGDIAAGTLVVRETPVKSHEHAVAPATATPWEPATTRDWDVSGVSAAEIATVRRFLERRESLDREARAALARRLADGLAVKVPGGPSAGDAERFLQTLVALKTERA